MLEHLATIERAIAFTCRRNGIVGADAEDFASAVKLKLVENDYAILNSFEGRASFTSFISVVVQRMLCDDRNHRWGKWHASSEAKRLGELAVAVERLILRDGRTVDEALPLLARSHAGATREEVEKLLARLPPRPPRRRFVDLEEAEPVAQTSADEAERPMMEAEREEVSARASSAIRQVLEGLPEDDQLILQLRFESGMSVAQIARSLHIEQKLLYRRIERQMRTMRDELVRAGIDAEVAHDILDHRLDLDLDLGNSGAGPSPASDGALAARHEEISG